MAAPLCEPVTLAPGAVARFERVSGDETAPATARLAHFHAPSELVLFESGAGTFYHAGGAVALAPGMVIHVPSFAYHDFAISEGERGWRLVQFDAEAARRAGAPVPSGIIACLPDAARWARIVALADWQGDAAEPPSGATARLAALLWAIAPLPVVETGAADQPLPIERFRPVLERLHARPERALPIAEAAALCTLSPTHFSRRFARIFGAGLPNYQMTLRLNMASRRLLETCEPSSSIAMSLGFSSPAHFTARFRERFGTTPVAFRRAVRKPG